MCTECTLAFFLSPVKSGIVALSFTIAIAALVMLRRLKTADTKKRLTLLYIHVFAFAFPFLFFAFFRGCQQYFSGCSQAKAIVTMIGLTALIATIIAAAVAPVIFAKRHSRKSLPLRGSYWDKFTKRHAETLVIKQPKLYALNTAAPVAFSFSLLTPRIFLSAGLFDILGRKEIEAIVLHELAHIRNKASFFKLSAHVARLLSPFAALANFMGGITLNAEEESADLYAATTQGTYKYLDSAKSKMAAYNSERSSA
ncbi:M48 family metalloprotease [Candidatus Woesearchaeota archaeon]|nr:M48 family metalloprotease [Candidatus Woesearchaeota archaeon]